ncbi:MAG: hypothetical protein E5X37_21400 [Mesorhizobium sp.]|nr:MAG: hypothetical protein E5X37_21400 [Mesorhizobium sp.]
MRFDLNAPVAAMLIDDPVALTQLSHFRIFSSEARAHTLRMAALVQICYCLGFCIIKSCYPHGALAFGAPHLLTVGRDECRQAPGWSSQAQAHP